MERSNEFLGTERVGRLMGRYAVPCVISLLVGALYNIVDQTYWNLEFVLVDDCSQDNCLAKCEI